MRFIHLADLHLGRSLAEFSLIELQKEFLTFVVQTAHEKRVDAVIIAGDVYDRSLPSIQAVQLLNGFLSQLARMEIPALLVSGNHDSAERLGFLSDVLNMTGIYIAGEYELGAQPVTLHDEFGPVHFHLMPFIRSGVVRAQVKKETVETYDDAVRIAVNHLPFNADERNVLVAHQFVCAAGQIPMQSESEMPFLGGVEMVHASHFDRFDYVALGHLHQPQRVGRDVVRYAGAPLKYAAGEADSSKSLVLIEMKEKGSVSFELIPIRPSINLRSVCGKLDEIMSLPRDESDNDFLTVRLTDEDAVYDALQTLRTRYPRVISVRRDRDMIASAPEALSIHSVRRMDPLSLFDRFCEELTGYALTDAERAEVRKAVQEAREVEYI